VEARAIAIVVDVVAAVIAGEVGGAGSSDVVDANVAGPPVVAAPFDPEHAVAVINIAKRAAADLKRMSHLPERPDGPPLGYQLRL
jgi:hypothetical protein